jgi:cell division protein FtsI/penicillin-binding protein 2
VAAEYPSNSESIVLTLDERIQYVLETELAGQCENFQAKSAVGIVMDPRTGEVFALANYPAYDLNRYNDPRIPPVLRRNRATWWPYEPGSAFKIVTLAALLDSGKITPDEPIFCENGLYKPHPRIKAIKDVHPYGTLTFAEVIQKSSNIGTLKAAQRLSQQEFRAYIHRFGLDSVTGVDLPYERRGNVAQVTDPRAYYGMFFVPWGQGVSVTPLQVLSALNVIANKGRLMRPHIVRETLDASGHVQERVQPVMVRQVISEAAAQAAAQILAGVVEKGTGTAARLEGVRVAGKTGTSQKASDERRGYLHGRYMSSFIGFFPVEEPRYSILILVDEPQGLHYGGQVAAPVFRQVAEKILAYETTRLLAGHLPKMPDGMDFSRYAGQAPLADDDPSKKDAMSLHPVAESGAP